MLAAVSAAHDRDQDHDDGSSPMSDDASRPRAAAWRPTVADAAPEALGERFGGVFVDDGGMWVVKAVARTDADYASVRDAARRLVVKRLSGSRRLVGRGTI